MYFLQSWLVVSTTYGVRWIVKHGAMCQVAHTESKIPLTRKYKLVEDHISKEADRDVNALIEICLYYQRLNPNLVITFESQTRTSRSIFLLIFGLKKVKLSFCSFDDDNGTATTRKHTILWTNSIAILKTFRKKRSGEIVVTKLNFLTIVVAVKNVPVSTEMEECIIPAFRISRVVVLHIRRHLLILLLRLF